MRVLAYSRIDPAGRGIANKIISRFKCRNFKVPRTITSCIIDELNALLAEFEDDVIYFDFLDEVFTNAGINVEYYVILSRHSAISGIKSLTTHHTGNFTGKALAGGKPYELSIANPALAKAFLINLSKAKDKYGLEDFEVTYEVTHHGPTGLKRPLTFIEIGSSENEWSLEEAHNALSDVVVEALSKPLPKCTPCLGIGGPHYARMFTERALSTDECYAHIIPKYALSELKGNVKVLREMIVKAVEYSAPKPEKVVMLKKVGRVVKDVVRDITLEYGLRLEII